jgi:hypothetical protein
MADCPKKNTGLKSKETKSNVLNFIPAQGSVLTTTIKRKQEDTGENNSASEFNLIFKSHHEQGEIQSPLGLLWDGDNYSCAYDALLTMLHSILSQSPRHFKDMNCVMNVLASDFHHASQDQGNLESVRNKVRHLLHQRSPNLFLYGCAGTPIIDLAEQLLRSDNIIASSWFRCIRCGEKSNTARDL